MDNIDGEVVGFIDVGTNTQAETEALGVEIGNYIAFRRTGEFLNGTKVYSGKAVDDRAACAIMVEAMKRLKNEKVGPTVYAVGSVMEEIGLRGARVAGYDFEPDMAFVIDSTPAFDLPLPDEEAENTQYNCRLGAGPAIYLSDAGTISDPRLVQLLVRLAEEHNIPCQFRQPGGGGTDAGAIHTTGEGVPSVSISIPGRYAHSPVLHAKVKDWQNTLDLMRLVLYHTDLSILTVDR